MGCGASSSAPPPKGEAYILKPQTLDERPSAQQSTAAGLCEGAQNTSMFGLEAMGQLGMINESASERRRSSRLMRLRSDPMESDDALISSVEEAKAKSDMAAEAAKAEAEASAEVAAAGA